MNGAQTINGGLIGVINVLVSKSSEYLKASNRLEMMKTSFHMTTYIGLTQRQESLKQITLKESCTPLATKIDTHLHLQILTTLCQRVQY